MLTPQTIRPAHVVTLPLQGKIGYPLIRAQLKHQQSQETVEDRTTSSKATL
jgi:hypothetical protein